MELRERSQRLFRYLDYLSGASDAPPPGCPRLLTRPAFWGVWWGALLITVYLFAGQSSKFIYIDF